MLFQNRPFYFFLKGKNEISLCDDPNEQSILELAKRMGLERVGWIVTDLVPDKDGKVKDVRNKDTHYVTAEGI